MTSTDRRNGLPDAEGALTALAERMRGAVAINAALVGIYSGGAWLAERLAQVLPGEHPIGYIDVSFYRDDYSKKGLRANVATTTLPFEVGGSRIVLVDRGGRELPIEPTYVGARVSVARNLSVVLHRHVDGRLELTVEPSGVQGG